MNTGVVNLDCETPEGQKWMAYEGHFASWLAYSFRYSLVKTPDKAAGFDFWVSKDGRPHALLEVKARETINHKRIDFGFLQRDGYLVTEDKLIKGMAASQQYGVPFIFAVWFPLDGHAAFWKIGDAAGHPLIPWTPKKTITDYSCNSRYNGRQVERVNAFLPTVAPYCTWLHFTG